MPNAYAAPEPGGSRCKRPRANPRANTVSGCRCRARRICDTSRGAASSSRISPARHAGGRVPAQPARACANPRHHRPSGGEGRVFTAADLPRMKPIRVVTQAPGARSPAWPPLATDKVRYVGEAIAACVAPTRDEAEDLAAAVAVDYEPLDAVVDARAQMRGPAPRQIARARVAGATICSASGRWRRATSPPPRATPRSLSPANTA